MIQTNWYATDRAAARRARIKGETPIGRGVPFGFFVCESCGMPVDNRHKETVIDENGESWDICATCAKGE